MRGLFVRIVRICVMFTHSHTHMISSASLLTFESSILVILRVCFVVTFIAEQFCHFGMYVIYWFLA